MSPACPLCGGGSAGSAFPGATRWSGRLFAYHHCAGCGATFVDPLPSADELDALFDAEAYHALHYPSGEPSPAQRTSLAWMSPHVRAGGALLDVGCGSGGFLRAPAEAGYRLLFMAQRIDRPGTGRRKHIHQYGGHGEHCGYSNNTAKQP